MKDLVLVEDIRLEMACVMVPRFPGFPAEVCGRRLQHYKYLIEPNKMIRRDETIL